MPVESFEMTELTWPCIEGHIKDGRDTVLVPCGTCEEHGPHLPCVTDMLIALELCRAAAVRIKALVAPPINLGVCVSTDGFPGTVGISPETLRGMVRDVVKSLAGQGFKKIVLATGHAGSLHISAMREACLQVARVEDVKLAIISLYDLILECSKEMVETPNDGHAGEIETSLVMYLKPELVQGTAEAQFPDLPIFEVRESVRKEMGTGVIGDPSKASAVKGKKIFESTTELLVSALEGL